MGVVTERLTMALAEGGAPYLYGDTTDCPLCGRRRPCVRGPWQGERDRRLVARAFVVCGVSPADPKKEMAITGDEMETCRCEEMAWPGGTHRPLI